MRADAIYLTLFIIVLCGSIYLLFIKNWKRKNYDEVIMQCLNPACVSIYPCTGTTVHKRLLPSGSKNLVSFNLQCTRCGIASRQHRDGMTI